MQRCFQSAGSLISVSLDRTTERDAVLRRLLIGLAVALVVLGTVGAYLLYAPKPTLPIGPIEAMALDIGGHSRRYTVLLPHVCRLGQTFFLPFILRKAAVKKCAALHPRSPRRITCEALECTDEPITRSPPPPFAAAPSHPAGARSRLACCLPCDAAYWWREWRRSPSDGPRST
jgi:hypothetical protein